jgi:branched-chain amino acid transport system permease protein
MWLLLNLYLSAQGRALRAIEGSEIGANTLGVHTFAYKVVAFTLSAALAGLAGALYAHFNLFASPETFGFGTSVLLVVMVALGGSGLYWGPFFGAVIFTAVPELLRKFQDVELLVFGLCMILVLLFFPGGIASLIGRRSPSQPHTPPANPSAPSPHTPAQEHGNGAAGSR